MKKLSDLSPAQLKRRRENPRHWLWYIVLAYVLILAFMQGSFAKLGSTYTQILTVAALASTGIALIRYALKRPGHGLAILLAIVTVAGFYVSESYRYGWAFLWDVGAFGAGVVAVATARLFLPERWHARWREIAMEKWHGLSFVAMVVAGWAAVSLVSIGRETMLPADPSRFAQIKARSIVPEHTQRWAGRRLGVALSGGGYRAAVFHAGTLHALETLGLRPSVLSTVSGGSIIGAYYAIGGDPVEFKNAVLAGRFNLKRELLMLHNAVRLPFPLTVPYIDVQLAPFYSFSRGDLQASLLRSRLFGGRDSWQTPGVMEPRLVIAATDLAYGMQVGLIPDGLVTLSLDGDRRVYRGRAFEASPELDLAERVGVSGAFPVAFPGRQLAAKVLPCASSGEGTRSLLLADGGIADNRGLQLLETVQFLAGPTSECPPGAEYELGDDWSVDTIIVSDASAIFGVQENLSGLGSVSRAFDIVSAKPRPRMGPESARPVIVSAAANYLDPHTQFLLYDDQPAEVTAKRSWRLRFDPRDGYPAPVLRALFALLTDPRRAEAETALSGYLKALETGPELDEFARRRWSRNISRTVSAAKCETDRASGPSAEELVSLPGICEAVALRRILGEELIEAFQVFQRTSTLNDWPPREDLETLFRLGQILAYKQWPELERALDTPP